MKFNNRCHKCGISINKSDLPNDNIEIINIYFRNKLLYTYCSKNCLMKHFRRKNVIYKKRFLFWFIKKEKIICINKKIPEKHFKVVFSKI